MSAFGGPNTIQDGLILALDPANLKSYPGSGTTWFDRSGNDNNGTLTNDPTFDGGNLGSISFDGINDYVQTAVYTLSRSNSTVSSWINISDFSTGKSSTGRIFIRRSGQNFQQLVAFFNGGYSFEVSTNSNPHELAGRTTGNVLSNDISANSWFYFSLVFDSNIFYGYVNGVLTGTAALSSDGFFDRIGDGSGFPDNYPAFFKGKLSVFKLYNRALSAAEVLQNYNATKGRFGL
jgi:hypothetical protein